MNVTTATVLKGMQERLSSDYLNFFIALRDSYNVGSPVRREAELALQKIQYSLRLIGRASGAGGTLITQNELDRLQSEIESLNKIRTNLSKQASRDREIAARLFQVQRETGVSQADLSLSSKMIREAAASRQAEQRSRSSTSWPVATAALSTLGHGAMSLISPMLGPFAGPISGMAAFATPFLPLIGRGIKSGFQFGGRMGSRALSLFRRSRQQEDFEDSYNYGSMPTGVPFMGMGGSGLDTATILSGLHIQFGRSLFEFYDKRAFNARWTKELLNAVKGQSITSGDGKGSGFSLGNLLSGSTMGLLLKGIGTAVAGILGFSGIDAIFKELFPEAHAKFKEASSKLFASFKESLKETVSDFTAGAVELSGSAFEGQVIGFGTLWSKTFEFMERAIPGWEQAFGTFSKEIEDFFSKGNIWEETANNIRYILENFKVLDEYFSEQFPILSKLKWMNTGYLAYRVRAALNGANLDTSSTQAATKVLAENIIKQENAEAKAAFVRPGSIEIPGLYPQGPSIDIPTQNNLMQTQEETNSLLEQLLGVMTSVDTHIKNSMSAKIPINPTAFQPIGVTNELDRINSFFPDSPIRGF